MERLAIRDKGSHNISVYQLCGAGLSLEIINDLENLRGIIRSWEFSIDGTLISGDTFEKLVNLIKGLIPKYGLQQYSECKKDILVIYIDNLDKIRGFFEDYITLDWTHYVQVFDLIEFRDISIWNKELHKATEIAKYAQFLIDNAFVPEKYFYLTPNQRPRKKIQRLAKAYKDDTAIRLYPDPCDYEYIRQGLFGGLCYCPYPGLQINEPLIEIDLDSAYIFDFLTQKHVMSTFELVDPSYWEYYLSSDTMTSIGRYKIKYDCWTNKCNCFKDTDGVRLVQGADQESELILNNIDLMLLIKLLDIKSIECCSLKVASLDYLPKYMRDTLVEEYCKKEELKTIKGSDNPETILQKVCVNGIYGDTIRKYETVQEIKFAKKKSAVIPQWGIWTTSYCKAYLLGLALQVDGWYYSDTDSIYCKDTPKNRKIIDEYNKEIQAETKEFCEKFGYDYEKLNKLGTFIIKNEIKKFKAITHKIYMYKTENDMILKAAGSSKSTVELNDDLFELNKIPVGERTFGFINNKSYFEIILTDEMAEEMTNFMIQAKAIDDYKKKHK